MSENKFTFSDVFSEMNSHFGISSCVGSSSPEESIGKALANAIDDVPNSYVLFKENLQLHQPSISSDASIEVFEETDFHIHQLNKTNEVVQEATTPMFPQEIANATFIVPDDCVEKEIGDILSAVVTDVVTACDLEHKDRYNLRPPCHCKLRKCNIDEDVRLQINQQYWQLDPQARKMWIATYCKFRDPKRRYASASSCDNQRRKITREFMLPVNGADTPVCQMMFLSTLGYTTDSVLQTLQSTRNEYGFVQADARGKHAPKHKLTAADRDRLTSHINKYNPCISHYRREHAPKRLYLPAELDIKEMYEDYKNCMMERGHKIMSYMTYWRQVKEMNISFAKLGVEECEICDEFKIHISEAQKDLADSAPVVNKKTKRTATSEESEANEPATSTKKTKKNIDESDRCDGQCAICEKFVEHNKLKKLSLSEYGNDRLKAETDKETQLRPAKSNLTATTFWL